MYEAARWNEDPRFQAPMISLSDGTRIFRDDLVTVDGLCYGKIKTFFIDVSVSNGFNS